MKKAKIYVGDNFAGILSEDDMGYEFKYDPYRPNSNRSTAPS